MIISIDAKNRIYLAADDEKLQTAVIRQVAQRHHIQFTTAQLQELRKMPFLSQAIQRLPQWLSASRRERQRMPLGIPAGFSDDQVFEYIVTSISTHESLYGRPIYFTLRADENLTIAQIKHVTGLLQQQGINRLHFIAEMGYK